MSTQQVSKSGVILKSFGGHFFSVELATGGSLQLDLETTDFNLAHAVFMQWVNLRNRFGF